MSIPTEPDEPTKAVHAPNLPTEIWLLIFRFDTSADTSTAAPYEPFQPCPDTAAARQVRARHKSFRTCERTKTPYVYIACKTSFETVESHPEPISC